MLIMQRELICLFVIKTCEHFEHLDEHLNLNIRNFGVGNFTT